MTSNEGPLRLEQDGSVLTLTLNRPDALNALDDPLLEGLAAALKDAAREATVRAVIVTGAGRAFSAGQDLKTLDEGEGSAAERGRLVGRQVRERYNPITWRLRTMEKPVIAAVNGVAAGAGLSFALACDLRLAAAGATFAPRYVKVGFIPAGGGTALLPALVGLARASELAFLGEPIDAARALEIGLVNRVVPAAELLPAARELAQRLASLPTTTIGLTKRAFNRVVFPDLAARLEYEAALQEIAGRTDDHREGVAAFREKRPPKFTGR